MTNKEALPGFTYAQTSEMYQTYKAFVDVPHGKPPAWFTPDENAAFAKIHANPQLNKAMDDFAKAIAHPLPSISMPGPHLLKSPPADYFLKTLDTAVHGGVLGAFGAYMGQKHYPDDIAKQTAYAESFKTLGDLLGGIGRAAENKVQNEFGNKPPPDLSTTSKPLGPDAAKAKPVPPDGKLTPAAKDVGDASHAVGDM